MDMSEPSIWDRVWPLCGFRGAMVLPEETTSPDDIILNLLEKAKEDSPEGHTRRAFLLYLSKHLGDTEMKSAIRDLVSPTA